MPSSLNHNLLLGGITGGLCALFGIISAGYWIQKNNGRRQSIKQPDVVLAVLILCADDDTVRNPKYGHPAFLRQVYQQVYGGDDANDIEFDTYFVGVSIRAPGQKSCRSVLHQIHATCEHFPLEEFDWIINENCPSYGISRQSSRGEFAVFTEDFMLMMHESLLKPDGLFIFRLMDNFPLTPNKTPQQMFKSFSRHGSIPHMYRGETDVGEYRKRISQLFQTRGFPNTVVDLILSINPPEGNGRDPYRFMVFQHN